MDMTAELTKRTEQIENIIKKYDELNDIGIKFINFKFFEGIIIKAVILSFIFMIF